MKVRRAALGQRLVRGGLLAAAGALAITVGCIRSVGHVAMNGPRVVDVFGIALVLAGVASLAAAARFAFAGTRRRTKLLVGLPLGVLLLQFWLLPVVVTGALATNAPRTNAAPAATLGIGGARDVTFSASDGTRLRGWFAPGGRRELVLVMHGSHGTRASTLSYVRFLHRAGYAVLAYDARGHGDSGGRTNAYGWYGDRDVAGAVAWARRSGYPHIAALGLSMGAEEALRAAAGRMGLDAVIADGAGGSTLGDMKVEANSSSALYEAVTWTAMRTVSLVSGEHEPQPLVDRVGAIRVPVLLIASNRRNERRIDSVFARRIGGRAELWYVADAGHTRAHAVRPRAYEQRVLRFLAAAA